MTQGYAGAKMGCGDADEYAGTRRIWRFMFVVGRQVFIGAEFVMFSTRLADAFVRFVAFEVVVGVY
jgi:hypothetical protein